MSKTIKAVFGAGVFAKTQKVFQYDSDDRLQFINVDLPSYYEVHFANSLTGTSVAQTGDSDGVAIPPDVFIPGTEIYAWVYIAEQSGGYTKYQATIPIYARAQLPTGTPTPAQQSALDEAISALNEAIGDAEELAESIPTAIDTALAEAKASGEFNGADGEDGNNAWTIDASYVQTLTTKIRAQISHLIGKAGATVKLGDVVFISDGRFGSVDSILGPSAMLNPIGNLHGEDGYSPTVTITEITGGHRVTITDANGDHVFDVMDGTGGSGGTSDYTDLTNKPSIEGVTLSGNKTASDLGLAKASDIPNVPVQSVNGKTGAVVLTASDVGAGTYSKPSGGIPKTDLASAVQTSLGKADTALQSAPVTSVNSQTGAVVLSIPSTAADVGAIAAPSSPATGAFLVWNGSAWAAQSLSTWQGGSY